MPGRWVQCDKSDCKQWVHVVCDKHYKDNKSQLEKASYYCPGCRVKERRKIIKWVVDELKYFDEVGYFYNA